MDKFLRCKKGFVISFITLLLLIGLISIVYIHNNNVMSSNKNILSISYGQKIRFIEADIAEDFENLFEMDIERDSNSLTITDFRFKDVSSRISDYQTIVDEYRNLTNVDFDYNLTNKLWINNTFISFNSTNIMINDLSNITRITMNISSTDMSELNTTNSPSNSGSDVKLSVIIENSNQEVELNETADLDSSISNSAFSATNLGSGISVTLENNSLDIVSNVDTILNELVITFNKSIEVTTGNISITGFNDYKKTTMARIR